LIDTLTNWQIKWLYCCIPVCHDSQPSLIREIIMSFTLNKIRTVTRNHWWFVSDADFILASCRGL